MDDTSLGWQAAKKDRIARIHLSPEQEATNWNWNSPYWLGLGAPRVSSHPWPISAASVRCFSTRVFSRVREF